MKMTGIILAGGRSRRFGEDKALATVDDTPLIKRSVDLLKSIDLEPVIITNESADYSFLKCRIERDLIPNKGPLGGLYTAIKLISGTLVVLTCDMPFLEGNALCKLKEEYRSGDLVTLFQEGERLQPFPGIYDSSLSERILSLISTNQLSMKQLLSEVTEKKIIFSSFSDHLFKNVNERKDLLLQEKG